MQRTAAPTQVVILGGSGDLSRRKLIPALLDLYTKEALPERFRIIGLARTPRTNDEFRSFITDSIKENKPRVDEKALLSFRDKLEYFSGGFDDPNTYTELRDSIDEYTKNTGQCTNVLIYLAVPPKHYDEIFENLHQAGFAKPCDPETGWTRILVEKPFGHDRASALALDQKLSSLFSEEQIYRIDHYLAKEAIQNILSFRFANTLMKDVWKAGSIKEITFTMHETVDVKNRGAFYDGIGAIRDVGQNHLLQLLAVVTMDEPSSFTPEAIREKRAEILESLKPFTSESIKQKFKRGQYHGYKETEGVEENSNTETAFWLETELSHKNWQGIPLYIEAAKAVGEKKVSVRISFTDSTQGLFQTDLVSQPDNEILLEIEPKQSIHIALNAKAPGFDYELEQRKLSFVCEPERDNIHNAYERVLMDCIRGDQTLFVTGREVDAQWVFINSIFDNMEKTEIINYEPGTQSPFI